MDDRNAATEHSLQRQAQQQPVPPGPETIAVGTDQAIVRRTRAGLIKQLVATVQLSEAKQEVYALTSRQEVGGEWKTVRTWNITAAGYTRLNGVAGIHLITPPTVVVDGNEQPNPYIIRNDRGTPTAVFIRKVGLGRSKIGNMVAMDNTLYLHPRSYLIAMLHKRKLLQDGVVQIMSERAWERLDDNTKADRWWLPTMEGVGLCVDITSPKFTDVHKSYNELVQFLDRRASTICTRNVLKHHPGMAMRVVAVQGGVAAVRVIGWPASDEEFRVLDKAAGAISAGEQPADVEVQTTPLQHATPDQDREGFGSADEQDEAPPEGDVIEVVPEATDDDDPTDEELRARYDAAKAQHAGADQATAKEHPGAQDHQEQRQPQQQGLPDNSPDASQIPFDGKGGSSTTTNGTTKQRRRGTRRGEE